MNVSRGLHRRVVTPPITAIKSMGQPQTSARRVTNPRLPSYRRDKRKSDSTNQTRRLSVSIDIGEHCLNCVGELQLVSLSRPFLQVKQRVRIRKIASQAFILPCLKSRLREFISLRDLLILGHVPEIAPQLKRRID